MDKLYDRKIWHNDTAPAINEDNLNSMSKALDDIDDRVINLADTVMQDIPEIIEDLDEVRQLVNDADEIKTAVEGYASSASGSAQDASDYADAAALKVQDAEAWSQGTRGGTPVPSTDPTYHNNAKYWAENTGWTISDDEWAEIMAILS